MKRYFLTYIWGLFFVAFCSALSAQTPTGTPPNILLVYVDDMGFGDLGCYVQSRFGAS